MKRRISLIILFLLLCFPSSGAIGEMGTPHEIMVLKDSFRFSPEVIHVSVGDTIKWINHDTRMHQFASVPGTGPTDELEIMCDEVNPEQTCDHTFNIPGEFPYFCFIHKQMLGLVVVEE